MRYFLGIDPGKSGGIALISGDLREAHAWRFPGDYAAAADLLREQRLTQDIAMAALERVHPITRSKRDGGTGRPEGVRSSFAFGENFGFWQGALLTAGIPYTLVLPKRWQTAALDNSPGDTKARALSMARRLFPQVDLRFKADNGKADALLIALWARGLVEHPGRKGADLS